MTKSDRLIIPYDVKSIQQKIFTIRRAQVMLDSDLALLYGVETRRLNEQVKRNSERFPVEFMFQLTKEENEDLISQIERLGNNSLRSQNATLESERGKHRKYLPYVFTEQGVSMLSAILRSETAVKVSIQIMNAFVAMRHFIATNANVFERLDTLELKQLKTDTKVSQIFDAINNKKIEPKQGIFYNGQIFDAYKFVSDLVRRAQKSIILIDNYIDETTLDLFSKKKKGVNITIYTYKINKAVLLDVKKFNAQYPQVEIKKFSKAHDRFLIIDDRDVYHIGASLKDLGKKWFAFSKFNKEVFKLMDNLKKNDNGN